MKKNAKITLFINCFLLSLLGISSIFQPNSLIYSSTDNIHITSNINFKEAPQISKKITWNVNGSPVCIQSVAQEEYQICSDGSGGAIVVWQDWRWLSNNISIYAQHIDSNGILRWDVNGTAICTADHNQFVPQIISDGAGGAIITWQDRRNGANYDIYAQRIDSNGIIKWGTNGIVICNANNDQEVPQICSDGAGGAIITWQDYRSGTNLDIYTQRIDSSGSVLWTINGVAICTESNEQYHPHICSDEAEGAIIVWHDTRESVSNVNIYAQRIDSNGIPQWDVNGTAICTAGDHQLEHQIISDGTGGAIIVWEDERTGLNKDIYTQRIDSNGNLKWVNNGTAICSAGNNQLEPQIISDGAGGAIITWYDLRTSVNYDIYVQHINSNGTIQWSPDGKVICTADYSQAHPKICSDGAGGAIITWQDYRPGSNNDIYAQRVDLNGDIKWVVNGIPICIADWAKYNPQITTEGGGTAIIVWDDRRYENQDIFAQKIENPPPTSNHPPNIITSIGGSETINWTLIDDFGSGNYRVLANNTDGDYYTWVDWTSWLNNTVLHVPINRTNPGYFDYTVEYYDDQHNFGVSDTVIVQILEPEGGINGYSLFILLLCSFGLILILTKKLKHIRLT